MHKGCSDGKENSNDLKYFCMEKVFLSSGLKYKSLRFEVSCWGLLYHVDSTVSCYSSCFVFDRGSQYHGQKIPMNCKHLLSTYQMWAEITHRGASTASSSTSPGESKTCAALFTDKHRYLLLTLVAVAMTQ